MPPATQQVLRSLTDVFGTSATNVVALEFLFWSNSATSMARNMIIYRTGQLGDTLASLPAIRAIRDAYPNDNFILLTDRQPGQRWVSSWDVLEPTRLFSEVLFYTPLRRGFAGCCPVLDVVFQIRQRRPAALFCLREFSWNHKNRARLFFRVICGIPNCYGCGSDDRQAFGRRDSLGKMVRYPREVDYYLNLVSRWGMPTPAGSVSFGLPLSDKERARIDAFWWKERIAETVLTIGIGPGSKMPAKRWPLDRFVAVGTRILNAFPECRLIVFGGIEDRVQGEEIVRALPNRVVNAAGKLTLLESAEALRRCHLYVGNDTGTMHIAAAVGTPCVAIFSARDHPGRWEPYGSNHVVLRTDPPCAGCLLDVCVDQDMKCLKDISVNQVMRAIESVLDQVVTSKPMGRAYAGI